MKSQFTLSQAANSLGVTAGYLRTSIKRGKFKATLIGKTYIVTGAEIERFRKTLGVMGRKKGTEKK